MKFTYQGTEYDLRLNARYLPAELRNVGSFDMMIMLDRHTNDTVKQGLLKAYLPEAVLA